MRCSALKMQLHCLPAMLIDANIDRAFASNGNCVESSGSMKIGTPDAKSFFAAAGSMAMLYSASGPCSGM